VFQAPKLEPRIGQALERLCKGIRDEQADMYLNLKVGGKTKATVVVKDPPPVTWVNKPVISANLIKTGSHGPNPGCSAGQVTDCIYPLHPGGSFIPKTASMTERSSSDPATTVRILTSTRGTKCV
jgi:hypothetical protein